MAQDTSTPINADYADVKLSDDVFGDENYKTLKKLLRTRVSEKRYKHSKGVAKTAKRLAKIYGQDPQKARIAGILHDWDKGLSMDEARKRARDLHVDVSEQVIEDMPWLLHGPTAAAALSKTFPQFGSDVYQAIARHTSGAADMTPLDCIIYVADIIEPNRTYGDMDGIAQVRKEVGKVSLEKLYFLTFKYNFEFLVSADKQLFPDTVNIWNALMWKFGQAARWDEAKAHHDAYMAAKDGTTTQGEAQTEQTEAVSDSKPEQGSELELEPKPKPEPRPERQK